MNSADVTINVIEVTEIGVEEEIEGIEGIEDATEKIGKTRVINVGKEGKVVEL